MMDDCPRVMGKCLNLQTKPLLCSYKSKVQVKINPLFESLKLKQDVVPFIKHALQILGYISHDMATWSGYCGEPIATKKFNKK